MSNVEWQPGITLDQMEKKIIKRAMAFWQDNQTATADALGISVKTLYNKLKIYKEEEDARLHSKKPVTQAAEEREVSLLFGVEVQELPSKNDATVSPEEVARQALANRIAPTKGSHAATTTNKE